MVKVIKDLFTEIFTILAWITLLGYVVYCTVENIKTDSIRDAWTILVLIAGFVWGSKHQKAQQQSDSSLVGSAETVNVVDSKKTE